MWSCKCAFVCFFFWQSDVHDPNKSAIRPLNPIYLKGFSPDMASVIYFPEDFRPVASLLISCLCTPYQRENQSRAKDASNPFPDKTGQQRFIKQ
jgi:hypothetical protein